MSLYGPAASPFTNIDPTPFSATLVDPNLGSGAAEPDPLAPNPQASDPAGGIAASSVFGSANFDPNALTPDALMTYLSSRLGGLDQQMNGIFTRENDAEHVRNELSAIQEMLTTLKSGPDAKDSGTIDDFDQFKTELASHIDNIASIDPSLASQLQANIYSPGQLMADGNDVFSTAELDSTKDYLNMVGKDIESSSQMDMISLQSLMSSRQTAVQLATNLIAACGDSAKAIATNVR